MSMQSHPINFIAEPIQVYYREIQPYEKKPVCPDGFTWRGEFYKISSPLEEWVDFTRRGRLSRNMREAHLSRAARFGSWGAGRFYFRVEVSDGRIFEIYYDRAVEDSDDRKGNWFLFTERTLNTDSNPASAQNLDQ